MSPADPSFWGLLAVILGPGGIATAVLVAWVQRKTRPSDEAAEKVAGGGPKPLDMDQALIVLSDRLEGVTHELNALRIYLPQVIGWGHRGWAHAHPEQREPLPKPPDGLAL